MRTLVLVKGQGYERKGVSFEPFVPKTINDDKLASYLLSLGKFIDITDSYEKDAVEETNLMDGIVPLKKDGKYVVSPSNSLGNDDLTNKRILFRRRGGFGDIVFVAVVAQYVKNKYPTSKITVAVDSSKVSFASCLGCFDSVCTYDESCSIGVTHYNDYIVEFAGVLGSEGDTTIDDIPYYEAHFERAGLEIPEKLPYLNIDKLVTSGSIQSAAVDVLLRAGFGDDDYVLLALGTSNPLKQLPINVLENIAQKIASQKKPVESKSRLRVLCVGGPKDRVFKTDNKWISFCTDQPYEVAAELARRSSCVVGADTGIVQFAAAVNIPTVSIFGPTDPNLNVERISERNFSVTAEGRLDCAPCKRLRMSYCPYFSSGYAECMKSVPVDVVVDSVYSLVNKYPQHEAKGVTVDNIKSRSDSSYFNVAVLLDNSDYYSGGGMYMWNTAKMFSTMPNVKVTVYADTQPSKFVYSRDDVFPNKSKLSVSYEPNGLKNWNPDVVYDMVVVQPPFLGKTAIDYRDKVNSECKVVCALYETPNYISKYRGGADSKEDYWKDYKESILKADFVYTISKEVKKSIYEWIEDFREARPSVWTMYPVVNTYTADKVLDQLKDRDTKNVVMISRNNGYKKLRNAAHVVSTTLKQFEGSKLYIIGQGAKKIEKTLPPETGRCEVELLENVGELDKWRILNSCFMLVHPSTFEGFGIPIAEAMYSRIFVAARPLKVIKDSFGPRNVNFFEDEESLRYIVESCYEKMESVKQGNKDYELELDSAYRQVKKTYTPQFLTTVYNNCLKEYLYSKQESGNYSVDINTNIRLAVVGPWNVRCGIAETTQNVVEKYNCVYKIFSYTDGHPISYDTDEVVRCWSRNFGTYKKLIDSIKEFGTNIVHIHHENSIFKDSNNLINFIKELKENGIKVVITLHTYLPSKLIDDLEENCDKVITTKDVEVTSDKFEVVELPIEAVSNYRLSKGEARDKLGIDRRTFVVGSFGMWQPHKGFQEFLETYNDVSLKSDNPVGVKYLISGFREPKSQHHMEVRRQFRKMISTDQVRFYDDYADIKTVIERLSACDVLVFNYNVAHWISSSAAIRTGMAAGRPIVCTHSPMFLEFADGEMVLKVQFGEHDQLVNAITGLSKDPQTREKLVQSCDKYLKKCSPTNISRKYLDLYETVLFGEDS